MALADVKRQLQRMATRAARWVGHRRSGSAPGEPRNSGMLPSLLLQDTATGDVATAFYSSMSSAPGATLRTCALQLLRCARSLRPLFVQLFLLLLYGALLALGVRLYEAGILFSYGGSSFGQQIGCVAASVVALVAASVVASCADWGAVVALAVARIAGEAGTATTLPSLLDSHEHADEELVPLDPTGAAHGPEQPQQRHPGRQMQAPVPGAISRRISTGISFLRSYVLVPLPLLLPMFQSVHALLNPAAHSTALSATINVILFSCIGAATLALLGIAYVVLVLRRGKRVVQALLPMLAALLLYVAYYYTLAQDAPLRGVVTPALLFDPALVIPLGPSFGPDADANLDTGPGTDSDDAWDLWGLNPRLRAVFERDWLASGLGLPLPRTSALSSPSSLRSAQAQVQQHCAVSARWHMAEVLPRRLANFFTGSESCPAQADIAHFDPSARSLTIRCPGGTSPAWSLSPDWIARRNRGASDVRRHYEMFVRGGEGPREEVSNEAALLAAAAAAASSSPALPAGTVVVPTGNHSYFSARCIARGSKGEDASSGGDGGGENGAGWGGIENYFVTHVEKPGVTARARRILREQLFSQEYAAEEAGDATAAPGPNESRSGRPSATTDPPLLVNPPILLLFIDSMSRSHFLRSMPLTAAVLRRAHAAAEPSRAVRERVYRAQQRRAAAVERHAREREELTKKQHAADAAMAARRGKRDGSGSTATVATVDDDAAGVADDDDSDLRMERAHAAELARHDDAIRARLVEADAALTRMHSASSEEGSGSGSNSGSASSASSSEGREPRLRPANQYSVSEHFLYHVVDHHTRGNMQSMLCGSGPAGWGGSISISEEDGLAQEDPARFRGKGQPAPARHAKGHRDSACPGSDVVWTRLKRAGYVTASVVNECTDLVADLWGRDSGSGRDPSDPEGFHGHSADYEVVAPFCHPEYDHLGAWSNFHGPYSMRRRCVAGRHVHEYALEYARQFIERYDAPGQGLPWFLYLSFVEAHEGSLAVLRLLDTSLASFLQWALSAPRNPPLVVFASDHGSHMGPFFEFTRAGRVEHKLPALYTLLPERWTALWDVHRKLETVRRLDAAAAAASAATATAAAAEGNAATETAVALVVEESRSTYFTLHSDPFSPSPSSPYSPSLAPALLASQALSASVGLSLHGNTWALLTSREVYWFLRGIPGRTAADPQALEEREREGRWFRARQKHAQAAVEARVQELRSQQQEQQQEREGEEAGGRDESANVAALRRRAIRELAPALDLDMEAHAASLLAPSSSAASTSATSSPAAADGGVVLVREFIPLSLSRPIPLSRRCDQAGIQDTLCVCNRPDMLP